MVFSLHVCLYIMCVTGTCRRPEVGIIPGIGVTGSCEPPCGFWKSNQGAVKECPVLFSTEGFQPPH